MRTPWRMLADLVWGKSSKDETEPQTNADEATPPGAAANKTTASASAATSPLENAVATSAESEIALEIDAAVNTATVDDGGTVAATTPIDEPVSFEKKAELASPSTASEKPNKATAHRRVLEAPAAVKAKRIVARREEQKNSRPAAEALREVSPEPKSQSDEMSDLDRDIEELRKQLAEKLKLQNAQLRKLIDRYESR